MDWLISLVGSFDGGHFAPQWVLLIVDGALKATCIVLIAGVVTLAMRSSSAAARHAVWALAVGSVLLLPALATLVPTWDLGLVRTEVPRADAPAPVIIVPAANPGMQPLPAVPAPPTVVIEDGLPSPVVVLPAQPAEAAPVHVVPEAPRQISIGSSVQKNRGSIFFGLALTWMIGFGVVMATFFGALFSVNRMERKAKPVLDPHWLKLVGNLRQALGIGRPVSLVRSDSMGTPATWGVFHPVVLIPANADTWTEERQRDVLVHELAHVKRYDFLTQMIGRYACAMFWFNPLVWLATRQMRVERERACDDEVLASGTKASSYAGHLLEIARSIKVNSAAGLVAVSMAHRSQLTGRLLAVLEDGRPRGSLTRTGRMALWICAVILLIPIVSVRAVSASHDSGPPETPMAVLVVPDAEAAVPDAPTDAIAPAPLAGLQRVQWVSAPECSEEPAGSESRGTNSNSNNDRHTIRWWDGDCEGELRMSGDVEFTNDFTDIARVPRGGRFILEIDSDGDSRRVEIEGGERRWFVNGREQPYGSEAAAWLPLALEDLFRHSSIALNERVPYILANRGVQGLIQQASYSHGSYLAARYYAAAIETGQLQTSEIEQILQRAIRDVTSDFEMARLLMSVPANELRDPALRRAYVQASNTISSDFEKRRVLSALLKQPGLETDVVAMLLGAAQDIQSDFELATLLTELGPRYLNDPETRELYLDAALSIQSDFELRRTLTALLQRDDLGVQNLRLLLQAATSIDSDFESASLLIQFAGKYVVDPSLRTLFFQSVDNIGSDFEKRRVLNALLVSEGLDASLIPMILNSGSTIGSDFEVAQLLTDIVGAYDLTPAMRPVFFRTVGTIGSDFEQQRVLVALIGRDGLPEDLVSDVVRSTSNMSSDFPKATVLVGVAAKYRNSEAVRSALEEAAETISSDHEYGRVMAAIRGRRTQ